MTNTATIGHHAQIKSNQIQFIVLTGNFPWALNATMGYDV